MCQSQLKRKLEDPQADAVEKSWNPGFNRTVVSTRWKKLQAAHRGSWCYDTEHIKTAAMLFSTSNAATAGQLDTKH